MCNFIVKAVIGVACMIWLRWTLPRLRIDQVMTTCLKYCVPLASAMMAGAMLWMYFLPGGLIGERSTLRSTTADASATKRSHGTSLACRKCDYGKERVRQ